MPLMNSVSLRRVTMNEKINASIDASHCPQFRSGLFSISIYAFSHPGSGNLYLHRYPTT